MLIRMGNAAIVNVTAIDKIVIQTKRDGYKTNFVVMLSYEDMNGKLDNYSVDCGDNSVEALRIKDEIALQAREVELENTSTALENAIKGSADV